MTHLDAAKRIPTPVYSAPPTVRVCAPRSVRLPVRLPVRLSVCASLQLPRAALRCWNSSSVATKCVLCFFFTSSSSTLTNMAGNGKKSHTHTHTHTSTHTHTHTQQAGSAKEYNKSDSGDYFFVFVLFCNFFCLFFYFLGFVFAKIVRLKRQKQRRQWAERGVAECRKRIKGKIKQKA